MNGLIEIVRQSDNWVLRMLAASMLLFSSVVSAQWMQVTGSAPIVGGMYEQARVTARDDAYRKASLQAGAKVSSRQRVENGVLTHDTLRVASAARVKRSLVRDEYQRDNELFLVMDIELEEVANCPSSQASQYRKKVALLGFSIQAPEQARMGGLHDIDRGLSSALNQALNELGGLVVYESSEHRLYSELTNAPTGYTAQHTLTKAADFAKQMGAQFVVSGVVRDLGVADESAFRNSVWQRFVNIGYEAQRKRRFSVDLFVHDGFSGAIVWQQNFSLSADWNRDRHQKVGFASPEFRRITYGKEVMKLIDSMALRLEEELRCQPFMTRISRVDGKTLHFSSGASTGIRPGDKLALYRSYHFYDANQLQGVELSSVKTALTVSQVHPGYASGTVAVDPGRLNIQEDDLLIAW